MVVPTVLAINARRSCAWWSDSDSGAALTSSVVMRNSPWLASCESLLECVSSPSTEADAGINCCLLFGWGGAVTARWAHAGFRKPILHGERHQPIAIAGTSIP